MDTMIAYFSFVRMVIYSIIAVTFTIIAAFSTLVVLVMPGVPYNHWHRMRVFIHSHTNHWFMETID